MISKYRITFYESERNYVIRSLNELPLLVEKLWKYFYEIGVEAYEINVNEDRDISYPKWELDGKWYTTPQIERIKKLKAFL